MLAFPDASAVAAPALSGKPYAATGPPAGDGGIVVAVVSVVVDVAVVEVVGEPAESGSFTKRATDGTPVEFTRNSM